MEQFDSATEREFYSIITEFLKSKELEHKYKIVSQPNLSDYTSDSRLRNRRPDFIITKGNYPFIIVEIKGYPGNNNIDTKNILRDSERYLQTAPFELEATGADYFIVTNLVTLVSLESDKGESNEPAPFDTLFSYFDKELTENEIYTTKLSIISSLNEILANYANSLTEDKLTNAAKLLLKILSPETISYNSEGRFFHFISIPKLGLNNVEHLFFKTILNEVKDNIVCRYTTFDSLYYMLINKTYRMASDIAMNDRSEIDYTEKYINTYTPLHNLSLSELKKMNKSYISSCTTGDREDNLTMYRLYAEDSRGVCITFEIKPKTKSNSLILREISYAKGINNHPELDFIKSITSGLSARLLIKFRLIYLDTWKHFFKAHDYAIEQEVRLLYLENSNYRNIKSGWVIANPDRILSKYVLFDITNSKFPFKLKKITLGPNFPESNLNRRQIEVLLDESTITGVAVENSQIESYRKS